jgi:integrase
LEEYIMAKKERKSKMPHGEARIFRKKRTVIKNGKPKEVEYGNYLWQTMAKGRLTLINLGTKNYDAARKEKDRRKREIEDGADIVNNRLTVIQHLTDYQNKKAAECESGRGFKDTSVRRNKIHINNFREFLVETGREHLPLRNLTSGIITEYLDWRVTRKCNHNRGKTPLTRSGANGDRRFLLAIFRRAFRKKLIPVDVGEDTKPFKIARPRIRLPNVADVREVVDGIDEAGVRLLTRTIALTGMRSGEAMYLRREDITFTANGGIFHIQPHAEDGWSPKNDSSIRDVPIPKHIYGPLKALRDARKGESETAYVFLMEDGRPMVENTDYAYQKLLKAVDKVNRSRKEAGLTPLPEFTFRRLRHFFISWSLNRKKDPLTEIELIKLVEHCDTKMIRRTYYHIDLEGAPGEKVRGAAIDGDDPQGVDAATDESTEPTSPVVVDSNDRTQLHESTVKSMTEAPLFEDE